MLWALIVFNLNILQKTNLIYFVLKLYLIGIKYPSKLPVKLLLWTQVILLIASFITLLWFISSELRIRQALKWWSYQESIKRFLEAEKIRDDLLQESFIIRRNLEMLTVDNLDLSVNKIQESVKKLIGSINLWWN